jgi:uncharacterized protein (DUF1330 family)
MKARAKEIENLINNLKEHGQTNLNPSESQLRELLGEDRDGPLQFVNLLKFHTTAGYPDDHELAIEKLSGEQAYAKYGAVALKHVMKRGGTLVCLNTVEQTIIGPSKAWHQVAIMQYPNTAAFIDMLLDPEYSAALIHRDAGLHQTEVLVTRPLL